MYAEFGRNQMKINNDYDFFLLLKANPFVKTI